VVFLPSLCLRFFSYICLVPHLFLVGHRASRACVFLNKKRGREGKSVSKVNVDGRSDFLREKGQRWSERLCKREERHV